MPADADWRREIHAQLDAALEDLHGVVGVVVLVEYLHAKGSSTRRELVVRASVTRDASLCDAALEAVRNIGSKK